MKRSSFAALFAAFSLSCASETAQQNCGNPSGPYRYTFTETSGSCFDGETLEAVFNIAWPVIGESGAGTGCTGVIERIDACSVEYVNHRCPVLNAAGEQTGWEVANGRIEQVVDEFEMRGVITLNYSGDYGDCRSTGNAAFTSLR